MDKQHAIQNALDLGWRIDVIQYSGHSYIVLADSTLTHFKYAMYNFPVPITLTEEHGWEIAYQEGLLFGLDFHINPLLTRF